MDTLAKRNITLSLPAELIRTAKIVAAKQGTSVNELVRRGLEKVVQSEDEYAAAFQRILAQRGLYRTRKTKVARSDLYD